MANYQFAADTATAWSATNRVPLLYEDCYDSTNRTSKIGDGVTAYNSLPALGGFATARTLGWYVLKDPKWNGGVAVPMSGTSDETAALQAIMTDAKKTVGQNVVTVYCGSGVISLSSTVTIDGIGLRLIGNGVGSAADYTFNNINYGGQGTTIRWTGAAGIPMIKVTNYNRVYFEGIHFQGNQTTPPSELIYFEWITGSPIPGHFSGAKNCAFGLLGWMKPVDNGTTKTADYCVRYGGSDADNDMFHYENCIFDDRGIALFALDNTQYVAGLLIRCSFYGNTVAKGIRTKAEVVVIRPHFDACSIDYDVDGTANVQVYGNYTERSRLIAYCHLDLSGIKFWGGQMNLSEIVGGFYLRHDSLSGTASFLLDNVKIANTMATRPKIRIRGNSTGSGSPGQFTVRQCSIPAADYDIAAGTTTTAPVVVNIDDAFSCVANITLVSSAVFTPRLANGEWQAYTPALVGTGWAVGNGTIFGRWAMIGRTVHWMAQFTIGTTSTYTTSPFTLSLPIPAGSATQNFLLSARGDDQSAGNYLLWGIYASTTTVALYTVGTLGLAAQVGSTNPFPTAATDAYVAFGTYEAA